MRILITYSTFKLFCKKFCFFSIYKGFDPFKIPSRFAISDGAQQATRLIDRHIDDHGKLPETVAMVLWGTDNLKSEGGPIGQALSLMVKPLLVHVKLNSLSTKSKTLSTDKIRSAGYRLGRCPATGAKGADRGT